MKEDNKKRNLGITLGLIILFIMVIGVTYAAFQYTKSGTKENTLTTGTISFKYNETSNGITLSNAMPTPDSEGKKSQKGDIENGYFDFNVDSHLGADTEVQYYVYAVDVTGDIENKLDPKYVKVYLTDQSSPENPYKGYDGDEVPVYSELDNVEAQSIEKEPVEGKLLYQNKFTESGTHFYRLRLWVSDEYEDREVARTFKMRVDVNTDAEITSSDIEKPTCTIENAQPKNASRDEDITMNIKCNDNNGVVTSNMTSENIHVKQNGSEVSPTKKELGAGIATAEITGNNGVQHTLTLNGFEKEGPISISIDKEVVTDKKGNKNDEINLETGVSISKRVTVTLANGGGVTSFGDQSKLTCDLKEGDTCNVTLPTITPQDGYTGSFWAEEETAHSGTQPGSIEVSNDTTYYAIGYKDITLTYEKDSGVETLSEESGSCRITGHDETCEVTLPTITGKTGYKDKIYWGESIDTEYDNRIQEEKVTVSDNKTYYAFAKDETPPVCSLNSATPSEPTTAETVTIKIDCTDTSGSLKTDLTTSNLTTKVASSTVSLTKNLTSTTSITNGKRYTITLKGFTTTGALTLTVAANAVTDNSDNGNTSTTITPSVTIKSASKNASTFANENTNSGSTWSSGSVESHKMYNLGGGKRYIGDTPYNYLKFEGDSSNTVWRIIGVFNDPSSTNDTSAKIKIMTDKNIGNQAWDTTKSNNWANASLQKNLNSGTYWTSTLPQVVKNKIETMKWYLGGTTWDENRSTESYYQAERGNTAPSGASATWNGSVGLIYPSDFGYTYANGVGTACYNTLSNSSNCSSLKEKSWMWIDTSTNQWTITPFSDNTNYVFLVRGDSGGVGSSFAYFTSAVRPVVYLKSDTLIKSGSGQSSDPYIVAD